MIIKIENTPPKMAKSEELLEKWSIKKLVLWKEKKYKFYFLLYIYFFFLKIMIFWFFNLFYI